MPGITNPHDAFFRETLSRRESAISFVREFLPQAVVSCFDLDSIDIRRDSFVDLKLRTHFSDLVCQVRLREGGHAYVYCLIEHKTTPERLVAFQLLRYATQIWHRHVTQGHDFPLPPVIPMVFYHGQRPWRLSTDFSAVFQCAKELDPFLPRFQYLITDLTRFADDEIRGIELLRAPLLAMRHYYDGDLVERIPRILRVLATVVHTQPGLDVLMALWHYLSTTDRVREREFEDAVQEAFPGSDGQRIMATITNRWIQQGLEQGLEEGLRRAAASAQENVLEVLETRFQNVPHALRARIERLEDLTVLSRLHRTALTAASIEDFVHQFDSART